MKGTCSEETTVVSSSLFLSFPIYFLIIIGLLFSFNGLKYAPAIMHKIVGVPAITLSFKLKHLSGKFGSLVVLT